MEDLSFGIDLGTSTSEISVFRDGRPLPIPDPATKSPIIPSLVAINKREDLLVGEDARSWVNLPGHGVREVKRKMGSGEHLTLKEKLFRPEELSALILRKLRTNAEEYTGLSVQEVVLSVPANFADAKRKATMTAGELAGLKISRLINEPTAAALAFGINNLEKEEQLAVFDFGGGTLDISILEMVNGVLDVKSSYGDDALGGKDIDESLIGHILERFKVGAPGAVISERQLMSLKGVAEEVKKHLSTHSDCSRVVSQFAVQGGVPVDLEIEITRQEFEMLIAPLLDRARTCVRQALAAKGFRPSSINRVLLVGGTTYIPIVRQLVAEMFGKEPKRDVDPDLAVSMGACIQAALAHGQISEDKGIILTDVCPFGLGVDCVVDIGGQLMVVYSPLMEPNTTIPYSTKQEYRLIHPDQREVDIHIYQDHTGKARFPQEAVDTGVEGVITDIPPALYGTPHPLEVEFNYTIDGVAEVKASIPGMNKSVTINYKSSALRMDDSQKAESKQRLDELWKQNPKAKEYVSAIKKAEEFMAKIPPQERAPLSQTVADLKEALTSDNAGKMKEAHDRLIDLLFDLDKQ